jgi:Mg/Co/Ni transporter MgtE
MDPGKTADLLQALPYDQTAALLQQLGWTERQVVQELLA